MNEEGRRVLKRRFQEILTTNFSLISFLHPFAMEFVLGFENRETEAAQAAAYQLPFSL